MNWHVIGSNGYVAQRLLRKIPTEETVYCYSRSGGEQVIPFDLTTFSENDLKTVTIGSGIKYLGQAVFEKTAKSNPKLESITFTSKTCEEIKNIVPEDGVIKFFPWLYYVYGNEQYYLDGYKADIIGTDGVCSY